MKLDRLSLVEKIGEEEYLVDPAFLSTEEESIYRCRNREYYIGDLPGVTSDSSDARGCDIWYHQLGTDSLPKRLVNQRAIFWIIQRDSYTCRGSILELVRDVNLVRRILDRVIQREGYETMHNKPKKHKDRGDN